MLPSMPDKTNPLVVVGSGSGSADEDADGALPMTPDLTQNNTAVKTDNRKTYSIIIIVAGTVLGAALVYVINKKNSR